MNHGGDGFELGRGLLGFKTREIFLNHHPLIVALQL